MRLPHPATRVRVRLFATTTVLVACMALAACGHNNLRAAAAVGALSVIPGNELEQIYYLGIFDPQSQIPEAIYRVTVKGQSSTLSGTHYASGWVPAAAIDSLGSRVAVDVKQGTVSVTPDNSQASQMISTGRRLMLFGPEGFRESPRAHRLVIVMGQSPEKFFQAIDQAVAQSGPQADAPKAGLQQEVIDALAALRRASNGFRSLKADFDAAAQP